MIALLWINGSATASDGTVYSIVPTGICFRVIVVAPDGSRDSLPGVFSEREEAQEAAGRHSYSATLARRS